MRSTLTHPPNPTLAIRVGVAGTLQNVESPELGAQIRSVLRIVKESVNSIHREPDSGYDPTVEPKLMLICALAAGADQFVADIALEEGYRLHVPLAYPRDKYVEMNFERENLIQAQEHFDRLYAQAESKLELDGTEAEPYDTAGSVLVGHSDLLFAIWDLGPGKGPGGTADSVEKAVEAGIPVVRFDSKVRAEPALEYAGVATRKPEELKPILRDILQEGLRPPRNLSAEDEEKTAGQFRKERANLRLFLEESEKRTDWSPPYQIIIKILALNIPTLRFRSKPYAAAAKKEWAPIRDTQADCARDYFQSFDMWPDSLAVYYANWMRGIVSFSLVFGALIVDYVLAVRLWPGLPEWLETACAVIALLSALLIWWANHRSIHRRWLQYRMLSEDLRNAALALAIGATPWQSPSYRSFSDFRPNWVVFYTKACIRAFGIGNARLDGAYLNDYRVLLAARVRGQYCYHQGRSKVCAMLNRHVRRVVFAAFLFSFIGAILHIGDHFFCEWFFRHLLEGTVQNVIKASLELTILSTAIAALAAQEGFDKLAQSSSNTAIHLNRMAQDIENAPLNGVALREQARRAREELRREHEDWYLLYSLREIEYS